MTGSKLLILALATILVDKIASYTYHIAFLGREQSNSTLAVGEIHFKALSSAPTISSMHSNCTDIEATMATVGDLYIGNFSHPDCVNVVPSGTELADSGIKVQSSEEFFLHVYQMDDTGDLADGYLAIPDEYLGTEYFIGTYCSLGGTCQFAVTGTEDVTSVTIVFQSDINSSLICANSAPVSGTSSDGLGIPFTINEFDVLHIESRNDLSGTYIRADKKIGVIVGARNVPANSGESSYMIEQIPPVSRLGTTFLVAPNHFNEAGDVVKIVAVADNTVVHVLGFSPFVIPRKGQHVERRVDWHVYSTIEASNPVLILQLMSVDLYNATNNVQGRPSMVLVPHIDQWTDKDLFFHCLVNSQENTSITFTDRTQCGFMPQYNNENIFQSRVAVGTTEYIVIVGQPTSDVTNVTCEKGAAYGYCRNRAAVLLGASWQHIQEDCQQTVPYPGDNKDNDCDGQIDEDTCTENDLQFDFHAEQYPNGTMIFKKIAVANVWDGITFTVQTCDMAVILLRSTTTDVENTFTVYISPSSVTVCGLNCTENKRIVNCSERQDYQIAWRNHDTVTEHAFWINVTSPNPDFNFNITGEIRYMAMIISALAGSADFTVKLPIKDCGKIVAGDEADNFGEDFVMPFSKDTEVTVFLTASDNETRVEFGSGTFQKTVPSNTTVLVSSKNIESNTPYVTMKATGGEISVYVVLEMSQGVTAFSVLPTDVLGPSYHLHLDYDETPSDDDKLCNVLSKWGRTSINLASEMNQYLEVKVVDYKTLPPNRLLKADRPVVVFCGHLDKSTMQIPPAESLGTHFYIPKLDLTIIKAKAEIRIIATEDSTVVIVMGDYDRLDTIDLTVTGEASVYKRTMDASYMYEIKSTTPIQVMLKFTSVNDSLTVLHIPPVEQYKHRHIYPDLRDKYTIVERSAVDSTGNEVNMSWTSTVVNYNSPTFALTVYKTLGSDHFIIASDVRLNDINKPCKVTAATAGDNKDNDCDGLIDEEVCPAAIIPGEVDIDIDGSLNEDCAENGTVPQLSVTLDLPERNIACPSAGQNVTESNSDTPNTGSNQEKYDSNIIIGTQSTSPRTDENLDIQTSPGSGPTYQTLEATRKTVPLSSTESLTNIANNTTQTEAEETCTTDCVCPCGWVDEKNYTEAEIQKKVEEIQEKLRLTKDKLSASIRQKTSAPDDRPSATAVGFVGVAFLVAVLGTMVLLDITAIVRDLRTLLLNLREVFQH